MDLNHLMSQLGPMQERLQAGERERREARLEGRAGGGAVSIVVTGDLEVASVGIAPACAAAVQDDPGMLEDLIAVAVGDALRQYRERFGTSPDEQMQKLLGGDIGNLLGPLMGGAG